MNRNETQHDLYADWLNLQLHVLWCYDHRVAAGPSGSTRPIYWGCNSAWLVRSGFAQVERNGIMYRANAGEWLIVPKGTFSRSFAESTHLLSIGYNAQWPDGQLLFDDGLPLVINPAVAPDLEKKAKQLTGLAAMPTSKWDTRKEPVSCRTFLQLHAAAGDWFVALLDVLASHDVHPNVRQDMDLRVTTCVPPGIESLSPEGCGSRDAYDRTVRLVASEREGEGVHVGSQRYGKLSSTSLLKTI